MPTSMTVSPGMRRALTVAILFAVPAVLPAQGRAESIVVTVPAVRVRTQPSMTSLSIDEFAQGSVFVLASQDYQYKDWVGVMLDGRIGYVPRIAVAQKARAAATAPVPDTRPVMQAGAPAPARPAPTYAAIPAEAPSTPAPKPAAAVAAAPAPAPAPAPMLAVAPAMVTTKPAPAVAAPSKPAPEVAVAPAPRPLAPPVAAERAPAVEPVAVREAARSAPRADSVAERKRENPVFAVRRPNMNLTIGVFGAVTPVKSNGLTPSAHVSGISFVGARYRAIGIYFAPEYGQGGGYKTTMMGGGLSLDLLNVHLLRVTALGGVTNYTETSIPADTTIAPASRMLQGTSMGGMVSIPFAGPARLAYRAQYVLAHEAGVPVHMLEHSVGLVF